MESINVSISDKITNKKNIQGYLKGIPSSPGIYIADSFIIDTEYFVTSSTIVSPENISDELIRFEKVIENLNYEYDDVLKKSEFLSASVIPIIETYQLLINDEIINSKINDLIKQGYDVESAVIMEYDFQRSLFRNAKDNLLKERAADLDNVKRRILTSLNQKEIDYSLASGKILVAQTISPTDIVKYKEAGAMGIITEMGGIASHVSILARSFEMPAVIGVKDASKILANSIEIIIDGFTGLIIYNPDYPIKKRYEQKLNEIEEHRKSLGKLVKFNSETIDKHKVHLLANIDRLEDVKNALISGSEGIGLVRSESLLLNSLHIPDEETQYGWYREISDRMYPNPVTIRCFDIGSDKFSDGIPIIENNPALGLRGIRFLLYSRDVFKTQIKAILRASENKNVRIMLPMVTNVTEILQAKVLIQECMSYLKNNSVNFDKNIQLGIMIETPAAALMADELSKVSDFFSIGTNDLTQYTLAADRTNDLVTEIYDAFHPAVLKLISVVAKSAKNAGITVGICGELASHSAATQLLIGLGINELSVPPALLLELKNRILKINYKDSIKLSDKLIHLPNSSDILRELENEIN
jgi:phosphotransferase system enzyme I (PtsI)